MEKLILCRSLPRSCAVCGWKSVDGRRLNPLNLLEVCPFEMKRIGGWRPKVRLGRYCHLCHPGRHPIRLTLLGLGQRRRFPCLVHSSQELRRLRCFLLLRRLVHLLLRCHLLPLLLPRRLFCR